MSKPMIIVVTGATGFIGSRLCARLGEADDAVVTQLPRGYDRGALAAAVASSDAFVHLAGVTRPRAQHEFDEGNRRLTEQLAETIRSAPSPPLVIFASSVRAVEDTEYGRTKRAAEDALLSLGREIGASVAIFRLAQVFGRGAKPYYNAITATLLADAAQGKSTRLNSPDDPIELVDVADVIDALIATITKPPTVTAFLSVAPTHRSSVGTVAAIAAKFGNGQLPDATDPLEVALFGAYQGYAAEFSAPARLRTP